MIIIKPLQVYTMEHKPKGGRGLKAPYETTIVRVPIPIKPSVDKLIADYRHSIDSPITYAIGNYPIPLDEAVIEARKIIDSKKSARVSLIKLLQVIYGDKIDSIPDIKAR